MATKYEKFCFRCGHYESSLKDGIICGLTKAKPTFWKVCEQFELDELREEKLARQKEISESRWDRIEAYDQTAETMERKSTFRTGNPTLTARASWFPTSGPI